MSETAIKRKAHIMLSEISSKQNNYRRALDEFHFAQNNYPYTSGCGNGQAQNAIFIAMKYSEIYRGLKQLDSAIGFLSRLVMDNDLANNNDLVDSLTQLLRLNNSPQSLLDSINSSINNIRVCKKVVWKNIENETDEETQDVLQTTTTNYYGRVVYWNYLGYEFELYKINDYLSRLTYPNSEKRKKKNLKPNETNEELISKAQAYIRTSRIYQNLVNSK